MKIKQRERFTHINSKLAISLCLHRTATQNSPLNLLSGVVSNSRRICFCRLPLFCLFRLLSSSQTSEGTFVAFNSDCLSSVRTNSAANETCFSPTRILIVAATCYGVKSCEFGFLFVFVFVSFCSVLFCFICFRHKFTLTIQTNKNSRLMLRKQTCGSRSHKYGKSLLPRFYQRQNHCRFAFAPPSNALLANKALV